MPPCRSLTVVFAVALAFTAKSAPAPGGAHPETPRADGSDFAGVWVGTVTAPDKHTNIALAFVPDEDGKALAATLTMPAMFLQQFPLGPAAIKTGTYDLPSLNLHLARKGDKLVGTFAHPLLQVELQRGDPLPPAPPLPVLPPGPAPLWETTFQAETWASPVARDGILYIGCVDGSVHALRAADGAEVWTWTGAKPIYGTALATAEHVYVVDDESAAVCLDRATGKLRWRTRLGATPVESTTSANPTFNHRVPTPVLVENAVVVGSPDHGVYALDAATGRVRWRRDVGAPVYATVTVAGDELIVGTYDGSVVILDRSTGSERKRGRVGGPVVSAAVVAGDRLIVGSRDYLLYGLRREDLGVAWRDSYWFSWVESVPNLVDGLLYIGGSDFRRISAIEPDSGKTRWSTDVRGLTWGTPVVTKDTVYAATHSQNPAAIRHQAGIMALDRHTGTPRWRHAVPISAGAGRRGYIGSLLRVDGALIGVAFDGTVTAYPIE